MIQKVITVGMNTILKISHYPVSFTILDQTSTIFFLL